ncbi:MAG: Pyridoxine 4-dehydrogenase [Cirrosporium novae-zelandiae]|nr:MAG: Pyridoxine 4-dehydrogenase [Cirrosporium novae-zelandiae]
MPTLAGKEIGDYGFGLMGLTWRPQPPPKEQAFQAMRTALAHGANLWNGGEFYQGSNGNSLTLLTEYFTKYPEDADKVVICIKGGAPPGSLVPDGSEANARRSVEDCLKQLKGTKTMNIFEYARVDPNVPIEETIGYLKKLVDEGKIEAISLSEVKASTIEKAAKVAPICAVEAEFSLWSTDILTNGVAATCAKLGIPIVAYSPLGRGFLTGQIKSPDDIPEGDFRKSIPRFQPEAFDKNLALVEEIEKLAKKKGCRPSQLSLAWVKQTGEKPGMPTIIPIPGATTEARVTENFTKVRLMEEEMKEIDELLAKVPVTGNRYGVEGSKLLEQ